MDSDLLKMAEFCTECLRDGNGSPIPEKDIVVAGIRESLMKGPTEFAALARQTFKGKCDGRLWYGAYRRFMRLSRPLISSIMLQGAEVK